jgi:copper chaperone NosL
MPQAATQQQAHPKVSSLSPADAVSSTPHRLIISGMKKMSSTSRIIIAVGSLALIAAYLLPFWSIYLIAPQYPEGLSMQIWLYKLTGQVDIINGLNHYIGMKHIKAEMFPEFNFLVYVFALFIIAGLLVAIWGRRRLLLGYLVVFLIGGIAALVDFYQWGYDYGHDLDPHAAIQVPGLSYQPPLIGHKKLLNFDAFSLPDAGAWVIIGVVSVFFIIWIIEGRRKKVNTAISLQQNRYAIVAAVCLMISLVGCTPQPEKIIVGKDDCAECKMTIADPKFGGEIVTKKGKVYKFDDPHCMAAFLEQRTVELSAIDQTLFVDYENNDRFVDVKSAEFVISSQLKTPMGGNAAAFNSKEAAQKKSAQIEGSKTTNWATLYNILVR